MVSYFNKYLVLSLSARQDGFEGRYLFFTKLTNLQGILDKNSDELRDKISDAQNTLDDYMKREKSLNDDLKKHGAEIPVIKNMKSIF